MNSRRRRQMLIWPPVPGALRGRIARPRRAVLALQSEARRRNERSFTQQRYTYSALPYRDSSNVHTAALKMDENSTVTRPRSVSTSAVTLRAICFIG